MKEPRPTWMEAVEWQLKLWLHFSRPDVKRLFVDTFPTDGGDLDGMIHAQLVRLFYGEPFFVSAEMCDLVQHAAMTWQLEPFVEENFLARMGFLYYEKPVVVANSDEDEQSFRAFDWAISKYPAEAPAPWGIIFGFHGQNTWQPREFRFEKTLDGPSASWKLAQVTLRLMQEFKPASRYSARPDRALRREMKRLGFEERNIAVVRLRRTRSDGERLGTRANYSCRFMISGHWRNQWYPSKHRHHQIWIAPHIKGPDDKPFRPTMGRAFTFSR